MVQDPAVKELESSVKAPCETVTPLTSMVWTWPLYMEASLAGGPLFLVIWMGSIEWQTMFHIPFVVQAS